MKSRIAVCLLTCDRVDYTARTVTTFARFNGGDPRFELLHGDDASVGADNGEIARQFGFETVVQSSTRRGWRAMRIALFQQAARRANWILFLENDIESLRSFPWPLFDHLRTKDDIYCLRLYGRYKDGQKTDKCLETHKRRGHIPVQWRPWRDAPEPSQVGQIHWSAQPAVTRARELLELHRRGTEPCGFTVRVKKNVMAHFGVERTVDDRHLAREGAVA